MFFQSFKPDLKALLLLCLLCCAWVSVQAAPKDAFLVISDNHSEYKAAGAEIQRLLSAQNGDRSRLSTTTIDALNAELEKIEEKSPLVVAVGMQAVRKVLAAKLSCRLLAVMVPRLSFDALLEDYRKNFGVPRKGQISAVFMDQPVKRLVNLAKMLGSTGGKMGMLLSDDAAAFRAELDSLALAGDEVRVATPRNKKSVVGSFNRQLRGIDLFLLAYDPAFIDVTTTKQILYLSYRRRLPVIAYSKSMIRAGAVSGVYSSAQQIARQAAEVVKKFLDTPQAILPVASFPRYFSVECNESVARYLDVISACDSGSAQKLEALE